MDRGRILAPRGCRRGRGQVHVEMCQLILPPRCPLVLRFRILLPYKREFLLMNYMMAIIITAKSNQSISYYNVFYLIIFYIEIHTEVNIQLTCEYVFCFYMLSILKFLCDTQLFMVSKLKCLVLSIMIKCVTSCLITHFLCR